MGKRSHVHLSRRERQIMDVIYRMGRATVAEVLEHLPEPPSYSSVRAMLRILEEKGHLKHSRAGRRYVYTPTLRLGSARRSAVRRLVRTFFDGSTAKAVAALLDLSDANLTPEELQRLAKLIDEARKEEA